MVSSSLVDARLAGSTLFDTGSVDRISGVIVFAWWIGHSRHVGFTDTSIEGFITAICV
jgi:hypothetical protein